MGAAAASLLLIVTVWEARRAVAPPPAMSTAAPSIQPAEPLAPKSSAPEHLAPPQTTPTAEARILQLAAVTPPQYAALPTRSNEDADAAAFNQAMSRYSAAQYGDAARGLRTLTGRSPGLGHAQFFLGISELMTGDVAAARAALQRAAASDEQPFADESHFYLAKAALRAGNLIEAERQLKISVDREAGPPGDASRLLKELRALPRER
jgi:predicted Zn-dependent protease